MSCRKKAVGVATAPGRAQDMPGMLAQARTTRFYHDREFSIATDLDDEIEGIRRDRENSIATDLSSR